VVEDLLVDRAFHAQRRSSGVELATTADLVHLAPGRCAQNLPAHLLADALAAAALARAAGADPEAVTAGLRAYSPGAHRIVTVAEAEGITWVDDSKATNPHSAEAALTSLPQGTGVWICGGDTKGAQFFDLVRTVRPHLRGAVVIGKEQDDILAALEREAPDLPVTRVSDGTAEQVSAAAVEAGSEHPLASAVVDAARQTGRTVPAASDFAAHPGGGVSATVDGQHVLVGSPAFLGSQHVDTHALDAVVEAYRRRGATAIVVAVDGRPASVLAIADPPKATPAAAGQGAADAGELGAVASCDATGDVGVIGTHRDHD